MRRIYFLIRGFLFDLLFPRYCIGCKKEGDWICEECLNTIDIVHEPFCPECRRPTYLGEFCTSCKARATTRGSPLQLDGIFICANFEDGVLKDAIHEFKYEFVSDIGRTLGRVMVAKLNHVHEFPRCDQREYPQVGPPEFDLVIPVPLHEKRKRWRGFNQAEVLAKSICDVVGRDAKLCVSTGVLKRIKNTQPQMELDREGRLGNLKDVFVVGAPSESVVHGKGRSTGSPLRGKSILLVDDITTTGATLEECAKVLKENGAKSVWGIVLAKGK